MFLGCLTIKSDAGPACARFPFPFQNGIVPFNIGKLSTYNSSPGNDCLLVCGRSCL